MFILCEGMKWAHLPVAGGIYDQHPKFVEDMAYILYKQSEARAKEANKDKPPARPGRTRKGR